MDSQTLVLEQAFARLSDAEKTVSDQASRLKELSSKAFLDLFDVQFKVVADYPDMLEEYNQMREKLE